MNPDLKRHLDIHIKNPQHNYILLENCVHCKLDRRLSYGLNYQNPRCLSTNHITPITFNNLFRSANIPSRSISQPVLNNYQSLSINNFNHIQNNNTSNNFTSDNSDNISEI